MYNTIYYDKEDNIMSWIQSRDLKVYKEFSDRKLKWGISHTCLLNVKLKTIKEKSLNFR
jgi:hypothetical protein